MLVLKIWDVGEESVEGIDGEGRRAGRNVAAGLGRSWFLCSLCPELRL